MCIDCLFCRIGQGAVPAVEVFRNKRIVAFLDICPIREGHLQIVPCAHYETFDDLPPNLASEVLLLAQRLAKAQKALFKVDRVGFLFTGGDIAHAHAHLVPLVAKTDITSRRYIANAELTWQSLPTPEEGEMRRTAAAIRAMLIEQRGKLHRA